MISKEYHGAPPPIFAVNTTMSSYETLIKAADTVAERLGRAPLGLVLGSGLSEALDSIENPRFMDYQEIPGMPKPTTEGHRGALLHGRIGDVPILALCGRYEGIDERVIENDIDFEISIGDYVISGGELAAMVVIDAISRRLPGVLGNEVSLKDSFTGNLLDCPHYTRPEVINGQTVPKVLLSGDQAKIDAWRLEESIKITKQKRPDLLLK